MKSEPYPLAPGLWLDSRRAAWFETEGVLAVADCHLAYAWAQRQAGQLLPLGDPGNEINRLVELQSDYAPRRFILLGDVVHRAVPGPGLEKVLADLAHALAQRTSLECVSGNHDRDLSFLSSVRSRGGYAPREGCRAPRTGVSYHPCDPPFY